MKILYWAELFPPYVGGASILGGKLTGALVRRGHTVEVVTSHRGLDLPDEDEHDGIPLHRFGFWHALAEGGPEAVLRQRRRLGRLKERFGPDLLHLNLTGPSGIFHLQTARVSPCPTVIAVRLAPPSGESNGTLTERLLDGADWVTANSRAILEHIRSMAPAIESRSSVIYNGLESPAPAPEPLPFDPPHLVAAGRLGPEKGMDVAVDAFVILKARYPRALLSFVGDGPDRAALEARVREHDIAESVTFHGQVSSDTVATLMSRATAVIVPSRWEEAFGMVALEAALLGRPVVGSRVGGLPEVVLEGETGLLVPPNRPDALAAAIGTLLDDPERARALGRSARARALDCFGWKRYVDEYESLYIRLAKKHDGHAVPAPIGIPADPTR
jgi:glycogen(starch) synthase